jgi:predicted CXXCH cytochrome family protein
MVSAASSVSNIRSEDYVGPAVCAECHPDKHARWQQSLHRAMNRLVAADGPVVLRGDFDGARRSYAGGEVRFDSGPDGPTMSFWRSGALVRRFRVTRTIGWRYLQEYVGLQSEGPEPAGDPIYATEIRLPFGYWFRAARRERGAGSRARSAQAGAAPAPSESGEWVHQQYYDSWFGPEWDADGRPTIDAYSVSAASPWAARCAWCHNTFPFELRAGRAGELGNGLEQFVSLAPGPSSAVAGNLLPVDRLVTVGVSCESCHLGGRAHAREGAAIRFDPMSPDLTPRPGAPDLSRGRRDPLVVNAICGQCHSTPSPSYPGGAATRNSTEALDMGRSGCAGEAHGVIPRDAVSRSVGDRPGGAIKCTDCHDPHTAGPGPGAPDNPRHLAACARCHPDVAASAREHSGHDAAVASCLDCHMPRVVQGLSDVVRTHRIGSPAPAADLEAGAPNACNLCHLDRSIAWTASELARRWGRSTSPGAAAYGGLDRPVGEAWLDSGDPQVRITAAAAYARSPRLGRAALPLLLDILDDPVAYDRMRVLFAVEDIAGRRALAGYDPTAPPARRAEALRRLRPRILATSRGCASRAGAPPDAGADPAAPPAAVRHARASAGRSTSRCRTSSP